MKNKTLKKIRELTSISAFKRALYIILVAIQSALTVLFALSVKSLVNAVEFGVDEAFNPNSVSALSVAVLWLIITVVALCVIGAIASFLGDNLTVNAEKELKTRLFKGLFSSNYQNLSSYSQGDVISRFEGDVSVVSGVRVNLAPAVIATAVRLLGTLIAMLYLDLKFTLIVLLASIVVVVASIFVRKISAKLHKGVRGKNAVNLTFVQESLQVSPVIKAFGYKTYLLDKAISTFNGYKTEKLKQRYFTSFISTVVNLLFTGFYVAVAIYGVYGIKNGEEGISFGLITAMLQLVLQIKSPITGISRFFTSYAEMLTSGERLLELYSQTETEVKVTGFKALKLEGVSFSYGENQVINGVNLTVNKGDKVLIKGVSGVGKSTLIKVIQNLYSNYNGKVIVSCNEGDITTKTAGAFAFVPQESKTFTASVKENIILGEEYNAEKFEKAVKLAHFDSVINSLPNGCETVLGAQVNLSEGQAQRLSVARAIYSGAPVIVLDEPTSHLDGVSEDAIFESLVSLGDLTVIMVSHKKESEKFATHTYTLANGKLS